MALFAGVLFFTNYLATRYDRNFELNAGTFATATPRTRRVVRSLTEDVEVVVFFPRGNPIGDRIERFFAPLVRLSPHLRVERVDQSLATSRAETARVRDNGSVAVYRAQSTDTIEVGLKNRRAKPVLRNFDQRFIQSVVKVLTSGKRAYFYQGHAERPLDSRNAQDSRPRLRQLKSQLEKWNYSVRPFSVANGSTRALPKDADVVFIIGPEKPFAEAEIEVLNRALERGVRLFVALEPGRSDRTIDGLLEALGLEFDSTLLAAPASHLPLTRTPADFRYIFSNQFSNHRSVTTMNLTSQQFVALFYTAGSVAVRPGAEDPNHRKKIVLTTRRDTFADANGNLTFDQGDAGAASGWRRR